MRVGKVDDKGVGRGGGKKIKASYFMRKAGEKYLYRSTLNKMYFKLRIVQLGLTFRKKKIISTV